MPFTNNQQSPFFKHKSFSRGAGGVYSYLHNVEAFFIAADKHTGGWGEGKGGGERDGLLCQSSSTGGTVGIAGILYLRQVMVVHLKHQLRVLILTYHFERVCGRDHTQRVSFQQSQRQYNKPEKYQIHISSYFLQKQPYCVFWRVCSVWASADLFTVTSAEITSFVWGWAKSFLAEQNSCHQSEQRQMRNDNKKSHSTSKITQSSPFQFNALSSFKYLVHLKETKAAEGKTAIYIHSLTMYLVQMQKKGKIGLN